jgi:hypothetical protein
MAQRRPRLVALAVVSAAQVSYGGYWDMGNTTDMTIDLLNLRTWPWGSTCVTHLPTHNSHSVSLMHAKKAEQAWLRVPFGC